MPVFINKNLFTNCINNVEKELRLKKYTCKYAREQVNNGISRLFYSKVVV